MTEPLPTADDGAPRRLETAIGTFEVQSRDVIFFADGLPGFERCRHFVLLSSPQVAPLHCLHAVGGPAASFLAIDPRLVLPQYRCVLTESDRRRLGVGDETPLVWLALVAVDAEQRATVNLRAPIVVNPARMAGCQVMPHNSLYPVRHPLQTE